MDRKVKAAGVAMCVALAGLAVPAAGQVARSDPRVDATIELFKWIMLKQFPRERAKPPQRANRLFGATTNSLGLYVAALLEAGEEIPTELAEQAPAFPEPYYNQWASRTETATHTYNFCISPLTPLAVRGVTWIPGKDSISEDVSKYSPSLEVYAASLAQTYGQEKVPLLYAQPAASLVEGIATPQIEDALGIEFDQWPKSLEAIATQLGTLAAEKLK